MQLAELLRADGVRILGATSSKKRLFHDLGDMAAALFGLKADSVAEALMEREGLGPTGVGDGIALPHARLEGLDRVRGLFVRLEKPLEFDAVDRQPVDLVFALLAPADAGVEHLKALALVSRTMRDSHTCAKLRANSDPSTLHAILTEAPANQAA
ncbi:PTS sugar transporter subunit IIA [Wenxinia marina]|uniref:PTS IIA-like nitrogen-regulatory protein PtsN n=1 Tax=Wenxinia marina DSM 24838 TaxID=1123501 RepID=A0A0D0Q988_9RHOB|nr:PTS sugar transporter subunit IIA [Wenxinia marina]KIQ70989.1 PTS IIA-like nitrogen-regulatory protein PtsN [Wenxinia marina DSM 24838]GGL55723.1 PTS lactose transporter subunit IIC [Wenxinia marina]